MRHIQEKILVGFLSVFSGISSCSSPTVDATNGIRAVPSPNYILSKYSLDNQHVLGCREGVSEQAILNNLDRTLSTEGRHSYFLFEMGLCHYVSGERDLASLHMLRAANYSNSYDLRQSAKLLALEFLAADGSDDMYDVLWANKTLETLAQSSDPFYDEFSEEYRLTVHSVMVRYAEEKLEQSAR